MAEHYEMPCGCKFRVLGPSPYPGDPLPLLDVDVEDPPPCKLAWDMLARGLTAGVFQLESSLGRTWAKKLKPRTFEHMNALVALLRPGCLDSLDDEGVSMTERYVRRANGEPVPSIHPAVDPVVESTYGIFAFQEQLMYCSSVVAGFNTNKQDSLRKGVGKKLQDLMAQVGREFIEGVEAAGVIPVELGHHLWDMFKSSGRYLFNKSHSMAYGLIGYQTAYLKAHFPLLFYTSWLAHAREKSVKWHDEVAKLVSEAKLFDIKVNPPSFGSLEPHAWTDGVSVTMGLTEAKGFGLTRFNATLKKIRKVEKALGPAANWTWNQLVVYGPHLFNAGDMQCLIEVGAFPNPEISRREKLTENDIVRGLTKKELSLLPEQAAQRDWPPLADILEVVDCRRREGGICSTEKRVMDLAGKIKLLRNPPSALVDSPHLISNWERQGLGVALTCMRLDGLDSSNVTHSVKDLLCGYGGVANLGVEVQRVKEVETRRGKSAGSLMCFATVADASGEIDVTVFAEDYKEFRGLLRPQNNVLIRCKKDAKRDGAVAERIFQLS